MNRWLNEPYERPTLGIAFLVLATVIILGAGCYQSLLTPYDDAFFAYAAKRLADDGQWLDLKTRTGLLLQKPPLAIWLQALSVYTWGPSTWAARLPGLLVAACGLALAYVLLRRHSGHAYALLGCLVLVTSQQFIHFARRPVTEIYLTVWVMLALLFYWDALVRSRGFWWTGFFTGLAVMTKGTVGLMPYGIIVLHLLLSRSGVVLRSGRFWLAVLLTLAIIAPWHVVMFGRHGEMFVRHYIWQTQLSFITGTHHVDPWHWSTILRKVAENYWPWLLALVPSLIASVAWLRHRSPEEPQQRRWVAFLWAWFAVIFVFFHLTYVKRHQYVLPAYPAMAFLCAWGILHLRSKWRRYLLAGVTFFVSTTLVVALVTPLWPRYMDNNFYEAKLGAIRHLAAHPESSGSLLVLDDDSSYCFTCDTIAYYTRLRALTYDSDLLRQELNSGRSVMILVLTSLRERLAADLPPGWTTVVIYEDDQSAILSLVLR